MNKMIKKTNLLKLKSQKTIQKTTEKDIDDMLKR